MPDLPEKPHRTGFLWLDLVVGVSAILISIASLWVALRGDATQERLLAASVWPYLEYGTSNLNDAKKPDITLTITNAGVGPARVRWLTVYYEGRPVASAQALLRACCPGHAAALLKAGITSAVDRTVIVPHDSTNFLEIVGSSDLGGGFKELDHNRFRVAVRVCYCSVLDDCWLMDSRQDEPRVDNNCPHNPGPAYNG
jgi:hypothetical protein